MKRELDQILKRSDASQVLDAEGNIRLSGSHIHPNPKYYVNGVEREADMSQPLPKHPYASANPPKVITPGHPSDLGTTMDVSQPPYLIFARAAGYSRQGQAGSCYWLSPMNAIDEQSEWALKQIIVNNTDGTNSVIFRRDPNNPVAVKQDYIIGLSYCTPDPSTHETYASLGEKAYAYFRYGLNTYASINSGWPGSSFTDLGFPNAALTPSDSKTATAVMATLVKDYAAVICTNPSIAAGVHLIDSHAYEIVSVQVDPATGLVMWTLRNPWGNQDPWSSSGINVIADADIRRNTSAISVTTGFPAGFIPPPPPPIPGDANGDGKVDGLDFDIWFTHLQIHTDPQNPASCIAVGDFNCDGLVDGADFDIWFTHLQTNIAASGVWSDAAKAAVKSRVSAATYAVMFPIPKPKVWWKPWTWFNS